MVACLEKEGRAAPRGAAGYAAGNRSISDNRHDDLPTRAERLEGQDSEGVVVGVHYRSFPVYDGHGNMIATLHREASDTYSIKNEKRYNAWGSVRSYTNGGANLNPNKAYVANLGHTLDWETGLIYMRARYYEPSTGRFLNEDPDRRGYNWYCYASSVPASRADVSGRSDNDTVFWNGVQLAAATVDYIQAMLVAMTMSKAGTVIGVHGALFIGLWMSSEFDPTKSSGQNTTEFATTFTLGALMLVACTLPNYMATDYMPKGVAAEAVGAINAYQATLLLFMAVNSFYEACE